MTFEIVKGDLFDQERFDFDAIAQGVNCRGIMGAGIAVPFRDTYPKMYAEYQKLCKEFPDVLPGLMQFHWHTPEQVSLESSTPVDGPLAGVSYVYPVYDNLPNVYNLFTQENPGRNAKYEYLASSSLLMRQHAEEQGFHKVGLPWIGAGIGGLEKHNVEHILRRILTDSPVQFTLVEQ